MAQRVWGWRCGLLQVLFLLSSAVAADSLYRLVPPESYVVFGGDLEVGFQLPADVSVPNAFVRLRGRLPRDDSWVEITTMGLPLGRKSGTLAAACGVVEFAGRYTLTMFMHVDGPVLTEASFNAVWPAVYLRLPTTHFALMSVVIMDINSAASCNSRLHLEFLTLELYFQRVEDSGSAYARLSDSVRIAAANFTAIDKEHVRWSYACRLFDLDGFYQAVLRSSTGSTVSVSNIMGVTFSASYLLSTKPKSVFPCRETLDVLYTNPSCSRVNLFRMYKLRRQAEGSAASPLERVYVAEMEIHPDRSRLELNCSLFEGSAAGYCFVYVTVSKSGAVVEQEQMCLPTHRGAVLPQDGGWSPWTSWTTCSVTCGTGKQSRFRMCNSPSPDHGGRYCPGHAVQWAHCQVSCPPDGLPRTPLRDPNFDPRCSCGCTQTAATGQIVASGRCKGLAIWIIKTTPGQHITLTFRYFDLAYERQWVKVRNGERDTDDLLYYSRVQSPPGNVSSTANVMRLELMTEVIVTSPAETALFPHNATLPIHIRGFIASYRTAVPDPVERPPPLFRHVEASVMEDGVTIVGIVVCVAVMAAVVVLVVVQRKYWKRVPKYSAANEESPVHVSSAQSSQPSSPGPHVQVDMDIPLTGGSGARRKSSSGQRAMSRASSISSTCSAGLKKIRSRAESLAADGAAAGAGGGAGGAGAGGGSPKPSSKEYSNLGSPYSTTASPEDAVHDANFFRASPVLKHVAPRSPKVHPHRLKSSPVTPVSPLPSLTKHEMLTRKRQERKGLATPAGEAEGERVVTGSSGSGSTAKSSAGPPPPPPAAKTTAAEINLSKPPEYRPLPAAKEAKTPVDRGVSGSVAKLRSPVQPESVRSAVSGVQRPSQGEPSPESEEIPMMDSVEELLPHQLGIDSKKTPMCEETSFINPSFKVRRPTSLTESYSSDVSETRSVKSRTPKSPMGVAGRPSAMEERQTLLPKPDGQSPKSSREGGLLPEGADKNSKESSKDSSSSPSKSSLGGRSNKTLSPTRSIATPELEYDDFIMDDPLSYFEYEELGRLNWTGTEKIGRTRRTDDT